MQKNHSQHNIPEPLSDTLRHLMKAESVSYEVNIIPSHLERGMYEKSAPPTSVTLTKGVREKEENQNTRYLKIPKGEGGRKQNELYLPFIQ